MNGQTKKVVMKLARLDFFWILEGGGGGGNERNMFKSLIPRKEKKKKRKVQESDYCFRYLKHEILNLGKVQVSSHHSSQ